MTQQFKNEYLLGPTKKLVDLNKDQSNCEIGFRITCEDTVNFDYTVVDQTYLDSNHPMQYKLGKNGSFENIDLRGQPFQNYFLVLKADNPCKVVVENYITVEEIQRQPLITPEPQSQALPKSGWSEYLNQNPTIKYLLIIAVLGSISGGIYYFYFYKKTNTDLTQSVETDLGDLTGPIRSPKVPSPPRSVQRSSPQKPSLKSAISEKSSGRFGRSPSYYSSLAKKIPK